MSNTNQFVETFNAKNLKQRRAFLDKMDTTKMRTRSPLVAIGGDGAVFFFDDNNNVCYVCRYSKNFKDKVVACTVEDAESELDCSIDEMRDECDGKGLQFGDYQRCLAYIRAAEALLDAQAC
jgi:archaellum biogenesis ATPase FlaH